MLNVGIKYCLNCGDDLSGKPYCGSCGQRNIHDRLKFQDLIEDLWSQIFEWNLPWLYTIRELSCHPGRVCREYVAGRRARYVNPLKYVLYVTAVITFLTYLLPLQYQSPLEQMPDWKKAQYSIVAQFFARNFILLQLLLSPFIVVFFRFAYRKNQYSPTEITCFVFFLLGHCGILLFVAMSFLSLLALVLGHYIPYFHYLYTIPILYMVVPFCYVWLASVGFFAQNVFYSLAATLVICSVYWLLVMFVSMFLGIV